MTADQGMDAGTPSWQELKAERDDIAQEVIQLMHLFADIRAAAGDPEGKLMQPELVEHIRATRQERDALAAHGASGPPFIFDRYRFGMKMAEGVRIEGADTLEDATTKAATIAARKYPKGDVLALASTPPTSLARRDLLKQAEALEEAADDCVPAMHKMANWLRARAEECRRRATGGE